MLFLMFSPELFAFALTVEHRGKRRNLQRCSSIATFPSTIQENVAALRIVALALVKVFAREELASVLQDGK